MASSSLFGSDPWLATLLFCGAAQVAVVLGAFALGRSLAPKTQTAWLLPAVYLLGATESGWLVFHQPADVLVHLWGLSILWFLINRKMPWSLPILAALALVNWPLTLGLILTQIRWKVVLCSIVVLGSVAGLYWTGFSVGLVLASLGVLWYLKKPEAVPEPALSFCLLELVAYGQGLFGWTALAIFWGVKLEQLWHETEPGEVSITSREIGVPRRGFLVLAILVTVWFGVDGSETVINDVVLIGAQKEEVGHARLAVPHSLESWLKWRGPDYGVLPQDLDCLNKITSFQEDFVYLSGPLPDPRVAALLSIASQRPFSGWSQDPSGTPTLAHSCALFLWTHHESNLQGVGAPWVVTPDREPISIQGEHDLSESRVKVYLEGPKGVPRSMDSLLTATVEEPQPHEAPAASLVPYRITLHNPTQEQLDLTSYRGIRLAPAYPGRQPLRPIDFPVAPLNLDVLAPKASMTVTSYLRTSIHPLDYQLGVRLTKADGSYQPVPLTKAFPVRSWRVELPLDYPFKDEKS